MSSLTFPNGAQYSSMGYDPEGEIAGFNVTPPQNWSAPAGTPPTSYVSAVKMAYDVRGELASMSGLSPMRVTANGGAYETVEQNAYIHGHPCNQINANLPLATQPPPCPVDPNTGSGMSNLPLATQYCGYLGNLTFDIDGRITKNTIEETGNAANNCDVGVAQTADTRGYDAENHTIDDNCPSNVSLTVPNQCASGVEHQYGWGPNGKVRTDTQIISSPSVPTTTSTQTLHWDGDDLLFVTGGGGALQQLNIEKLGAIVTNTSGTALAVVDRDYAGMEVGGHGTNTAQGPNVLPSHGLNLHPKFSDLSDFSDGSGAGFLVDMKRNDGYQIGGLTIQGVRAYDPGAAQWSTPDAYKGDVANPMSQRPYMWNGNNSISYADPSGYDPINVQPGDLVSNGESYLQSSFEAGSSTSTQSTPSQVANGTLSSKDVENAVVAGYQGAVMSLHANLDPHNMADLQLFSNYVSKQLSDSRGEWSLIMNFMSATLSGANAAIELAFSAQVFTDHVAIGTVHTDTGVRDLLSQDLLRYSHAPGQAEHIEYMIHGTNSWLPWDFFTGPENNGAPGPQ